MNFPSIKITVWDFPLRLFHWLLVLSVAFAIISGELGGNLMDWHERAGLLILGLLAFRLLWGFIGTANARFCSFFPTLNRLRAYLDGEWRGYGHNPLGALSVIALLVILVGVTVTGLFANDDIASHGPLFDLVTKHTSDWMSGWHDRFYTMLLALVILHLLAIAWYAIFKKQNLVLPMLTGKKRVEHDEAATPVMSSAWSVALRFILAGAISVAVVWSVANGGQPFVEQSAPPPAVVTPEW
ncbi:MAG: cytochrome b/b6 domain-containing protein [Gallionellaceae bacterium]|jgi:cytochrome b|nr:cytochrome b/b6 domain-containing protein [Gallionellaceae bacterium]